MSEQKIQTKIKQRLEAHGWFVTKLKATSTNGIPDLLCIKKGKIAFLEVKTEDGVISELQKYMIDKLNGHGCYSRVVRCVEDVDVLCGVTI